MDRNIPVFFFFFIYNDITIRKNKERAGTESRVDKRRNKNNEVHENYRSDKSNGTGDKGGNARSGYTGKIYQDGIVCVEHDTETAEISSLAALGK